MKTISHLFIFATLLFSVACTNSNLQSKTFDQVTLYYPDSLLTALQIENLGKYLSYSQLIKGDVRIQKNNQGIYELSIHVDKNILSSQKATQTLVTMSKQLTADGFINNNLINILGCDEKFKPLRLYTIDQSYNLVPLPPYQ